MGNYLLAHLSPPSTHHPHTSVLPICIKKNRMAVNNLLGIRTVRMHCDASENCDISSNDINTRIGIYTKYRDITTQ